MKKFVLIVSVTGYILAGCNKTLLDTKPTDRYVESTFWTTPEAVNAGLTACYSSLRGAGLYGSTAIPLFEEAARLIVQNQVGSTSLIQRRMKLGYNRAGRLMDQLEAAGVVGMNQGSKARDVLIKTEAELENHLKVIL